MKFDRMTLMTAMDNADIDHEMFREGYSGRGMYGKTCPGVAVADDNEAAKLFVAIGYQAGETGDDDSDVMDLADAIRTDSMGKGMIIYFPGLELTGERCSCSVCEERDEDY